MCIRDSLYYRLNTINISVPALRERGTDATLLFRKFALDMSEKYKMPPVRLNDEAQRLLLSYSWPGNVRQLKNLAGNMSVTAEERDITPDILSRYLPSESRNTQLMTLDSKKESHSFENEREILYQILFDLRRDVSELKRYVREQQQGLNGKALDTAKGGTGGGVTLFNDKRNTASSLTSMLKKRTTSPSGMWRKSRTNPNLPRSQASTTHVRPQSCHPQRPRLHRTVSRECIRSTSWSAT